MKPFKHIALIANVELPEVTEPLKRLCRFLEKEGYSVALESKTALLVANNTLPVFDYLDEELKLDLVVVVGGDGSMLSVGRSVAELNIPLLGVNRGRLGFLTDIQPDDMENQLIRVLAGDYIVSNRFLLEISLSRKGEKINSGEAINDVVVHPGSSLRMMEFELYIDEQFVYSQRSDGLIVSTPTGSTAYALSGGGPILHPNLDAIVLVPMNPHTLSSRPVVVGGDSSIEIKLGLRNEHSMVTCDGQNDLIPQPGDVICIEKKMQPLRLIHQADNSFYATCRTKLGWGSRLGSSNRNR
ncbi:NAD(+) kinase [Porticoccus sp. Uisw_050_02]|jgi:NAD+ kinase|uniref:NAD(+) kinase n=1 Tax=Porticoccus sp. Uisw_050_02 TaxID=3230978 RepID=UPI0030A6684A|tara:strand:- start:3167 stop:4060 length:894 start_codon:yes stop_codon:yes gene_type:complete